MTNRGAWRVRLYLMQHLFSKQPPFYLTMFVCLFVHLFVCFFYLKILLHPTWRGGDQIQLDYSKRCKTGHIEEWKWILLGEAPLPSSPVFKSFFGVAIILWYCIVRVTWDSIHNSRNSKIQWWILSPHAKISIPSHVARWLCGKKAVSKCWW